MLTAVQKANTKPVSVSTAHPGSRAGPTQLPTTAGATFGPSTLRGARAALAGKPSRSAGFKKN